MKKLFLISYVFSLIFSCGSRPEHNIPSTKPDKEIAINPSFYAETITSEELQTLLYTYASDEFEGRETGEKGQKLAAEYLKEQYKSMDIPSPLGGDNYFQDVPLVKQKVAEAKLSVNQTSFKGFEDHIVLSVSESMDISVNDIVYLGFGIDADTYSDYKDVDVEGKVVLVKAGEPKDENGNYLTSGTSEETKWSSGRQSMSSKRDAAVKHGAKIMLLMDEKMLTSYAPFLKRQFDAGISGRLSLKDNKATMAVVMINETLGKALYPSILEEHQTKVLNTTIDLNIAYQSEAVSSENVVAYIKGSEKPHEIIVLSAHLDHEGIKDGEIYNGADDDGSGTVALLEIAEAFKTAQIAGHGPKRSILFLHVTGEEKGLLGSRHYSDNDPIFPLENTVSNLNIDMIGRTDPKRKEGDRNYIYLIGSDKLSTELHEVSEEVNKTYTNIELDYAYNDDNDPNRFYYRSDHYNFAKNNIPVIFYFNGTHDDYHRPSDTPDKIEYDLLENRTRLVFYTAWELANRADRIRVDKIAEE